MQATQAEATQAPSPGRRRGYWPGAAAVVTLLLAAGLPEMVPGRHLFVQTIQFAAFAMVIPALVVLGTPWTPRFARLPLRGAAATAAVFIGVCLAWRVPPALDALARHPVLQVPELATLLLAGLALWLQLVGSPSSEVRLGRPQRAAVAAIPMWSVWAIAYVLGFANHAVVSGYDVSGSLGAVTDQEITAIVTWAISAACFIPVIAVTMLAWLHDSSGPGLATAEEPQRPAAGTLVVRGWGPRSR
ncbi:MAG TPA: cytochrome c oxidase assembly protein [Trebonia sp.]|nr:cytochrome c oxidase assembly protein [Trebonia sp.]